MSDHPLPGPTELDYATFARDHWIARCFFLAGLAILIYDYFLTFGAEVKYIWSSKLRPGTCWFLAIRYLGLGVNITICAYYFVDLDHEGPLTLIMQRAWMALLTLMELLIEVTLTLRVFAMYGLNKWILASLLSANAIIAIVGLFGIIEYGKNPDLLPEPGLSGCDAAYATLTLTARPAAAWEAIVACDILVFALTARQAFIYRKTVPLYTGSLMERMATDGTMYFGVIVLANLANVLTLYLGDALLAGILSCFSTNLSLTLISRLMLNLREAADARMDNNLTLNTRDPETLRFATVTVTMNEES
ncbi:hypothetical protein C8R45DRAFT_1096924 [Mycena sanguinolenta]|nr:hypothetical protein C8R45DRAFT_1096924 [Mycena sanguinolenta]